MSNRRDFIVQIGVASAALATVRTNAQGVNVTELDPQATALGYKADATKVDKLKFPKYATGQQCAACSLFQGKVGDATGPCPIFTGRQVSAKGWCSAFVKKV